MSKKAIKKTTKHGLNVKEFSDRWSQVQTQLEALAHEQVAADIELVNATRALKAAEVAQKKAVARKTLAEQRLNTVRANLGGE